MHFYELGYNADQKTITMKNANLTSKRNNLLVPSADSKQSLIEYEQNSTDQYRSWVPLKSITLN